MQNPSLTSSETFQLRAQRSEQIRTIIMIATLGFVLLLTLVRRAVGGVVMAENRVFLPMLLLIMAMLGYETWVLRVVRRANRDGIRLEDWRWQFNAALELATVLGLLAIAHFFSPRGEVAALSAPPLLILPILIMLSVLRLRPTLTLATGIIASGGHFALAMRTILVASPAANMYPVLISYSVLLLLCGISGMQVARAVRRYVQDAAEEAAAREQAKQKLGVIEQELTVARDIQQGLLPSGPLKLEGFDVAGFYRPTDLTGGDYYDWQTLPDGKIAFVMADVVGHGIGPALVMAVCRAYARASAPLVPDPDTLLQRINQLVHDDVQGMRFVTLAIALLDPSDSTLRLASAGHGPTFLYSRADQSVEQFGGDGAPLGVLSDERYERAHERELHDGDVLLLLTDGFFEYIGPGNEQFGIARIEAVLKQYASESAESIIRRLTSAVASFARGCRQVDDMTAVVLKRTATAPAPSK